MADRYDQVIAELDGDGRAVLLALTDGEMVYPAGDIADKAAVPLWRTRKILRDLRRMGLAQHAPLFNDGLLCGSGTFLTFLGEKIVRRLDEPNG